MTQSVLAHIASTIAQKENLATNALAFILNRSTAARAALHRQMVALVGDVPAIARIATQAVVGDESRPDLMLHAADGATLGYIEAKFWAALTPSQPVEYIRRLAESGGGVLVMLAPAQRLPTLRAEVLERLKEPTPTNLTAEAMQVGTVRVGLLSWRRLLDALKEAVKDEHHTASDVQQLDGLVRRFETDGFIPLTRVDIDNQELPRLALALASLVPDIVDGAVKAGIVTLRGARATHDSGSTGRYVSFTRASCWMGLNHRIWAKHGRSPIWLRFNADAWGCADAIRDALQQWAAMDPPRAYVDDDDGAVRVPLLLRTGVEKDAVVAYAVKQLGELGEMMVASGMPVLNGAPPTE